MSNAYLLTGSAGYTFYSSAMSASTTASQDPTWVDYQAYQYNYQYIRQQEQLWREYQRSNLIFNNLFVYWKEEELKLSTKLLKII